MRNNIKNMLRLKEIRAHIKKQLDIKKQAEDLGVPLWQSPSVLIIFLGFVVMVLMFIVYQSSQIKEDPFFLIIAETVVVILTLFVGGVIIQSIEQMAKMNKMKSEFIAIASHQMKSPLAQIKWLLESIEFPTLEEKNRYEKKIGMIRQSNESMIDLTNDLLDVARIDKGEKIVRLDNVDIAKVAKEVLDEYRQFAKNKNIQLKLHNEEGLENYLICTDERRTRVVFDNLVRNALAYTPEGGHIEMILEKDERKNMKVCIKDNGIGIPESEQYRIFERFFRASNGKKNVVNGTGLGLYLTKNIVEQSGGKIWFRSIEGSGSMFCVSFPFIDKCEKYGK
ncbi:MAG: HAMP domain-containing histidine kinase [Candidatus Moranbacteria bacterium]|nr:HAMP domain-containing histidine kinase [Candidatus Moranbacteria bacterium]